MTPSFSSVSSRTTTVPDVPYKLLSNPNQLKALVMGRRKAIEVCTLLTQGFARLLMPELTVRTEWIAGMKAAFG